MRARAVVPAAGGDQPDAGLDEADVRLGQRLAAIGRQAQLGAAPERPPARGDHHRHQRVRHRVASRPGTARPMRASSSHSPSSASISISARLAPAERSAAACRSPGRRSGSLAMSTARARSGRQRVDADQVELGVELDASTPSGSSTTVPAALRGQAPSCDARRAATDRPMPGPRRLGCRRRGRAPPGPRAPPRGGPRRLVGAELPAEAPAHRAVHRRGESATSGPTGRRSEAGADDAAKELAGPVLGERPASPAGAQVRLPARELHGRRLDPPPRPVLPGRRGRGQDLVPLAAVEAGAGLLAERPWLDQPAQDRRARRRRRAGVVDQRRVKLWSATLTATSRPTRSSVRKIALLGPSDQRPGQLVDLVHAQPQLLGERERGHQAVDAQPVRDERGAVLGVAPSPCRARREPTSSSQAIRAGSVSGVGISSSRRA